MKSIIIISRDEEEADNQMEMDAGWYAAIIRMRIKRRQVSCQSWHESDSRKFKAEFFCCFHEARDISSSPQKLCNEQTKQVSILFYVDSTFQLLVRKRSSVCIHVRLCMYLCSRVLGPRLCRRILMSAIMHVWIYGCSGWLVSGGSGLDDGGWWWECSLGVDWWGKGLTGRRSWCMHGQ